MTSNYHQVTDRHRNREVCIVVDERCKLELLGVSVVKFGKRNCHCARLIYIQCLLKKEMGYIMDN